MSRSSFERIRAGLDLTSFLKTWDELPKSWDPSVWFGRVAPLELEIGSGKGLFLRTAAAASPEHDFLGIEVAYRYALTSAAGLAKNGVKNAKMVCADGAKLLAELLPPESLYAAHIYFPDPWWKKAHRKRRIFRADVVKLLESRLISGGTLFFRTDVEEYYRSTLALVAAETTLCGPCVTENGAEDAADSAPGSVLAVGPVECGEDNPPAKMGEDVPFLTHFERRTRLNHLPVYGCHWVKR